MFGRKERQRKRKNIKLEMEKKRVSKPSSSRSTRLSEYHSSVIKGWDAFKELHRGKKEVLCQVRNDNGVLRIGVVKQWSGVCDCVCVLKGDVTSNLARV